MLAATIGLGTRYPHVVPFTVLSSHFRLTHMRLLLAHYDDSGLDPPRSPISRVFHPTGRYSYITVVSIFSICPYKLGMPALQVSQLGRQVPICSIYINKFCHSSDNLR